MAELVPSVLLYGQAMKLLEELQEIQSSGFSSDTDDLIAELSGILTEFELHAGKPLVNYAPVAETEPPSSAKSNRFWRAAERDINLLQQQVDMIRAATIFAHNTIATEVANAYDHNARVNNKLKTLQLYSNTSDSSIITFGDSFKSFDFIDPELVPSVEQPTLAHEGYLTLGRVGQLINLSEGATVRILSSSNGFLGNNQEIEDPNSAPTDPESGFKRYTFKAEVTDSANLSSILDGEPNTWIEYEHNQLSSAQKRTTRNLNLSYAEETEDQGTQLIDWANGPSGGTLKLNLEFDLTKIENLNSIEFTPFGLEGNTNSPVLVSKIQTSHNGTDWTVVFPTQVYVGTDVNLRTARLADNVVTKRALWSFDTRAVRYVRVYLEQHTPVRSNVGHVYWENRKTGEKRVEGPHPNINNVPSYYEREIVGDLVQRREYFSARRWAIGIRDFLLNQVRYAERSVVVSKPLRSGGIIDRVVLESADISVPESYPTNQSWVNFYISPDDGENWYQIARVDDPAMGIPEQISFNDPIHESLREKTVANYSTDEPVTSVRIKVEMLRPSGQDSTTPVVKSYSLKVKRR